MFRGCTGHGRIDAGRVIGRPSLRVLVESPSQVAVERASDLSTRECMSSRIRSRRRSRPEAWRHWTVVEGGTTQHGVAHHGSRQQKSTALHELASIHTDLWKAIASCHKPSHKDFCNDSNLSLGVDTVHRSEAADIIGFAFASLS